MSRTLLKVAGEQNDPLRVKVFPHDFVDKPLLPLILLQKCIVYRKIEVDKGSRTTNSQWWKTFGLERIPESYIQVNGIHIKSNGLEIFVEYIIQAPIQVGMYFQMLERFPIHTCLNSPLELA